MIKRNKYDKPITRHLGGGFYLVDGRSDRDRRIDSDIEALYRARKAWHHSCHLEIKDKSRRDIRTEIVRLGGVN